MGSDRKRLELEEIKKREFEILKIFGRVCEENHLRYSLCGGTLLGAVRHGGFIPWDDDIDVVMPRPDYMKLIEIADDVFPDNIWLSSPYSNDKSIHTYGKLCDLRTTLIEMGCYKTHLYIDIFPIDGLPKGMKHQLSFMASVRRSSLFFYLCKCAQFKVKKEKRTLKKVMWVFFKYLNKMLPPQILIHHLDRKAAKFDFDQSKQMAVIVAGFGEREIMPKCVYSFDNSIEFENVKFSAMNKVDYYLTNIYGDYMVLPPIGERKQHEMEVYMNVNVESKDE